MAEKSLELDKYKINIDGLIVQIEVYLDSDGIGHYNMSIMNVSKITSMILEKIRDEFVSKMNIGVIDTSSTENEKDIRKVFENEILFLIHKYFPHTDKKTANLLVNYLIRQYVGMGEIEIFLKDSDLEEVVINSAHEPVRVFHKKYGWLDTNVTINDEAKIRHYSTMIGRDVGKEITVLKPLMDAHLLTGDRVNSTLMPISSGGNTITIRKFAAEPWSITDFLLSGTTNYEAAAIMWLAVENELPVIIAGGTGSGKTSMLNVISNFFPANQRIVSIEDTRELTLPKLLHWVPMETRLPNPEGKGGVSMLDLVVNSLRMRPDRIIVGEIRRKQEAEVLFEAMHTGHSVYGTIHANDVKETVDRLVNPPIEVPAMMLSSIGLIVVQFRNRRTIQRKTFQLAEMDESGRPNVFMQYNAKTDSLDRVKSMDSIYKRIGLFTGSTKEEIDKDINEKIKLLKWLVKNNVKDVHKIGSVMGKYYARKILVGFQKKMQHNKG